MIFDVGRAMHDKESFWDVLGGTERTQVAVMVLAPGEASSASPSVHPGEDQFLYVTEGEVTAELGDSRQTLVAGQCVIVPAGLPHRFVNTSEAPVRTLNVYAPPAY